MNVALDIVVVLTTVAAAYAGWRLGILRAGMAVFGIGAGVVLAKYATSHLTPYVGLVFDDPEMAQAVSVMAVIVGVLIASIVAGTILRRVFKLLFLGWLDSSTGAVVGVAVLLAMWSAGLNVVGPNLSDELAEAIDRAPVAGTVLRQGPLYLEAAPDFVREFAVAKLPDLGID